MKSIILILILAGAAWADTSDVDATYFHPAASLYIHGDSTTASNLVEKGLSLYPDDAKLKRLKELIKQQQQNQQEQNEQNQQQEQQNQDQEQQEQQNQDQEQQEQQSQQQDQNQTDEPEPQEPQQPRQPQDREMSPDEARQLMDDMKQEEKNERLQLRPVMGRPVKVDKDW